MTSKYYYQQQEKYQPYQGKVSKKKSNMQFAGGSSSLTSTKSRGASNEAKKYRAQ